MICTPQFIQVYNETFRFIREESGHNAVYAYWNRIADIILADLKELVREKGLKGCVDYWSRVLTKEDAHFRITLNDKFTLEILRCPSLRLLEEPYDNYCGHCDVMYRKIFEELGYKYNIEYGFGGGADCRITISK